MNYDVAIKIENLKKVYRIGEIGSGTLSHDLNRWFARIRKKEDPLAKVDTVNDRTVAAKKGEHVLALEDIDLEVKKGEILGIIGKNGAGKSTLLKVLSRVTSPSAGKIKVNGRMASLLEVGTGFHPEMTGRENIYMNGTIMGMRKDEIKGKLDEIVDFAGVAKYLDTPVKRYSSGMTVRLGFAVAAFLEPEILVVDEVLAVGDAEFQKKAIGKMDDISKEEERTILFVSHNMGSIRSLCTRSILIQNGRIAADGQTKDVVDRYLSDQHEVIGMGDIPKDYPRSYNSGEAFFTNIQLLDREQSEATFLNFKDPIQLKLQIESLIDIDRVIFGFHVLDRMGTELIYTEFPENDKDHFNVDKGLHNLKFRIAAGLVPGEYQLRINMMRPNGNSIDLIDGICRFTVSRDSHIGDHNFRWNRANAKGYISADKVEFQKL